MPTIDMSDCPCCGACCNCDSIPDQITATLNTGGAVPGLDGVVVTLTRTSSGATLGTWEFSGAISCGDTWTLIYTCDTVAVECVTDAPVAVGSGLSVVSASILAPGAIGIVTPPATSQCPLLVKFNMSASGYNGACGATFVPFTISITISE